MINMGTISVLKPKHRLGANASVQGHGITALTSSPTVDITGGSGKQLRSATRTFVCGENALYKGYEEGYGDTLLTTPYIFEDVFGFSIRLTAAYFRKAPSPTRYFLRLEDARVNPPNGAITPADFISFEISGIVSYTSGDLSLADSADYYFVFPETASTALVWGVTYTLNVSFMV